MLEIETTKVIVLVAVEGILLFCGRLGGKKSKNGTMWLKLGVHEFHYWHNLRSNLALDCSLFLNCKEIKVHPIPHHLHMKALLIDMQELKYLQANFLFSP